MISGVKFWIGDDVEAQYQRWVNADPDNDVLDKPRHTHMMQAGEAETFVTAWLTGPCGPAGPMGPEGESPSRTRYA